jgi:Winged helix DNA-binding domain
MQVTREQVLAFRIAAQGLLRDGAQSVDGLSVLDLGVQQAMGHPAALAFAARLPAGADVRPPIGPGEDLALAWTLRGAPHVHRRRDLDALAAALVPLSEADATGRLNETGPSIARKGLPALEQYATAVRELRSVVNAPTAKGAVSTAVTRRIPAAMRRDCRPCGTSHISDSAMRAAFLGAGLELDPDTSPPLLLRRPRAKQPERADPAALLALARRYLALLGPAGVGDFAGFLDARRADLAARWPDDLEAVAVEGRTLQIGAGDVAALRSAAPPELVRLLGPFDPFLQAGDRTLLVPDTGLHKALWPVLGRPGVLLVNGEVLGSWRSKATRTRITLTVEAFAPLPKSLWAQVEAEADRVREARAVAEVAVTRKG